MSSPDFLEKLAAYVPMPVARAVYHQPRPLTAPKFRRFPAAVLFADISGFTALSELLSRAGPTGSEELTYLINQYFTRMIRIATRYRGQVVKFSGDAMLVIFPAETTNPANKPVSMQVAVRRAGECALAMQANMSRFTDTTTSQGQASLSMRVGVGAGEVFECSIGGALGRWEYVVGGDPVIQVSAAETQASPGQVILSPQAWSRVENFFVGELGPGNQGFVTLDKVRQPLPPITPGALDWEKLPPEQRQLAEAALLCYIPGAIKARLNEQAEWLAELRRITVLFVGIGGFDYEADDVGPKLQNFVQAAQEVIYRYEGSLGKVAIDDKGTVMLILFGAPPFFHEDDSTRAVACALGLQIIAQERHLRMAVGIAEGAIFAGPVGAPGQREYTVIGDTVNIAARLMEYGRGGSIIISERVQSKAESRFVIESLGDLALKGKSEARPAYLVTGEYGVQDEIFNRYLLHEDPLVGRKAELEQMRRMAARARSGKLQLLCLKGELGLGKSRLAAELVREWMMAGGVGYGSKCVSYGQIVPYQGWREILVAIFGLTPSFSPEQKVKQLNSGLAGLPPVPDHPSYWLDRLPLLADVLGFGLSDNDFTQHMSAELRRDNTFELIEAILRHQADRHPLLILLEDMQWADESTLALTAHLVHALVDHPVLITLTYRPEASLSLLSSFMDLARTHVMRLDSLSPQESLDLVRISLGSTPVPSEVEELILGKGQGNPFFLQELTGAIVDVIGNQERQTAYLLETLNLPDTIQEVILARVDRLSEAEKLTLKIASVIGTHFQRLILSEVHPLANAQYRLPQQLDRLEHEKLVRLEQPAPKWEYVFRSVIAQEVVYEGLLLAQRRRLHCVVGEALENLAPDQIEQLAFHYKRGKRWEKALYYLKIASQRAQRENANNAAIGYYSEVLACLRNLAPDGNIINPEYWDTLLERAKLYNLIGWRDEELEDLDALGVMAEALDDDYRRALAAQQWAHLYETSGNYIAAVELIERLVALARKVGDEKLLGQGYGQWGKLLYLLGQYETATDCLEQALAITAKHQDKSTRADCLNNQGLIRHYQANYEAAVSSFHEAIELWQELNNRIRLGSSLCNLAQVYYDQGQYTAARQLYNEALVLHRTVGDRAGIAQARHGLGKVERGLGAYPSARGLLEEALTFYQAIGDRHLEAQALYDLGFLYGRMKEYDTALIYLDEANVILKELDAPWWALVKALIYQTWILHDQGQLELAMALITEALEIERDTQRRVAMIEDMLHLGRVALSLGDLDLAGRSSEQVLHYVAHQGLQGTEHPAMVFLTCYHILTATGQEERAREILAQGMAYLKSQADLIQEPTLRHSYLTNIPEHQALQELAINVLGFEDEILIEVEH